jgi:hypothetical protein
MSKKNKSQAKGFGAPKRAMGPYEIFVEVCVSVMKGILDHPDKLSTFVTNDGNCLVLSQLVPTDFGNAEFSAYGIHTSTPEINRSELLGDTNRFIPFLFVRISKTSYQLSDIGKYVIPALYDPDTHSFNYCKGFIADGKELAGYASLSGGCSESDMDVTAPLLDKLIALFSYTAIVNNPDSDTLSYLKSLQKHFALSDKDMGVFQEVYNQSVS